MHWGRLSQIILSHPLSGKCFRAVHHHYNASQGTNVCKVSLFCWKGGIAYDLAKAVIRTSTIQAIDS